MVKRLLCFSFVFRRWTPRHEAVSKENIYIGQSQPRTPRVHDSEVPTVRMCMTIILAKMCIKVSSQGPRTQVTGISFKFNTSKRDRHVPLCSSSLLNTQSMPDLSASLRLLISALVPQARDDEPLNGELLAHCQELLNR